VGKGVGAVDPALGWHLLRCDAITEPMRRLTRV
jgi:hypothetical protein